MYGMYLPSIYNASTVRVLAKAMPILRNGGESLNKNINILQKNKFTLQFLFKKEPAGNGEPLPYVQRKRLWNEVGGCF